MQQRVVLFHGRQRADPDLFLPDHKSDLVEAKIDATHRATHIRWSKGPAMPVRRAAVVLEWRARRFGF